MANAKLETRLNKRKNQRQSVKLNVKDRWYFLSLEFDKIQIISYDSSQGINSLAGVLQPFFEKVPTFLKMNNSAVCILHHVPEEVKDLAPTAIYAGNSLYGQIYVVAVVSDDIFTLEECDFLPFSIAINALDSFWFPSPVMSKVELILE